MPTDYLPKREAQLVTWAQNYSARITAAPTDVGLTPAQALDLSSATTNFVQDYTTVNNDGGNTTAAVIQKNLSKATFISIARELAGIIQKFPGTTDVQRAELGLTVPQPGPTPVPPPALAPLMDIGTRSGTNIRIRLHDAAAPDSRAKPVGVAGATVFSYIGSAPPADIADWKYEGQTTRTSFNVQFPIATAPGTQVWLTAFWYNTRAQSGPGCNPISARIAGDAMQQAA